MTEAEISPRWIVIVLKTEERFSGKQDEPSPFPPSQSSYRVADISSCGGRGWSLRVLTASDFACHGRGPLFSCNSTLLHEIIPLRPRASARCLFCLLNTPLHINRPNPNRGASAERPKTERRSTNECVGTEPRPMIVIYCDSTEWARPVTIKLSKLQYTRYW